MHPKAASEVCSPGKSTMLIWYVHRPSVESFPPSLLPQSRTLTVKDINRQGHQHQHTDSGLQQGRLIITALALIWSLLVQSRPWNKSIVKTSCNAQYWRHDLFNLSLFIVRRFCVLQSLSVKNWTKSGKMTTQKQSCWGSTLQARSYLGNLHCVLNGTQSIIAGTHKGFHQNYCSGNRLYANEVVFLDAGQIELSVDVDPVATERHRELPQHIDGQCLGATIQ